MAARTTTVGRITLAGVSARVDAFDAKLDAILARLDAPVKSAPAKAKAKSTADPFPVALAKARTRKCKAHKACGKQGARLFTPAGAEWHTANNGGRF